MPRLSEELQELLNKHSAESGSDTPDHILAAYLMSCLAMFNLAVKRREEWYGRTAHHAKPSEAEEER